MKLNIEKIGETLLGWGARFRPDDAARQDAAAEPPLRSALFSAEQMERHATALAGTHKLGSGRAPDLLLARLSENEQVLLDACRLLTSSVKAGRRITPAAEWLLDNFYLIEEQIRIAKRHLPRGYSRELPHLSGGEPAGIPRAYDIAIEVISHGDGRVDLEALVRFVSAYQKVTTLKLGELWAVPIMLRLALIENLRRVGARISAGMVDRNSADDWADQMMAVAEKDPKSLILVTADMARSNPPIVDSFVAELARRLQGQSPALALPLTWIEQLLSESGQTIEQLVHSETQSQAANQVSVSNSIGSLRFLGAMDWREFVETMSVVEQKLQEDPDGIYGRMDFATRDRYRHVIEKLAKHGLLSECDVARKAIQLAHEGHAGARGIPDERAGHVGYYLIDKGLPQLEAAALTDATALQVLQQTGRRFSLQLYLGAILLLTAALTAGLLTNVCGAECNGWVLALAGVVSLLCTSQLAVALVNWLAILLAPPRLLPRMDYSAGIPPGCRTLAVVPTMLGSGEGIDALVEALEVRFLANRDQNLSFGLLTDYRDADEETLSGDRDLLLRASRGIEELNRKYGGDREDGRGDAFFLFHRPRRWNPAEGVWMGYERKRGKLAELNALLRGGPNDRFCHIVGDTALLLGVKYVITLDTDTQLPRDAARQLVATMAHPLNRPHYDAARQRVTEGYGILQPRVAVSLPSSGRSRYARLNGSGTGIDPYTRAVSDVYQDLFGEGSFIGKGIYDVDVFELALGNRFPENHILSHDLLEGCYARSGLLSDVQLYEESPARYGADAIRRHRWIRGDWQIAQWVLSRVPVAQEGGRRNPISRLSQWKIFDNLRRSLVPAGLTLLLLLGWTVLSPAWLWTLSAIGIILIPTLSASLLEMFRKPDDALPRSHLASVLGSAGRNALQAAFALAMLPYEAFYSLHAIVSTLNRMFITRRRRLEWTPSGDQECAGDRVTDHAGADGAIAACASMWISPALAVCAALFLESSKPAALVAAAPILCLWFIAPAIAWWISRPLVRRPARLTAAQLVFLHKISRKTWAFFDTFVGAEDHWLPPDNFQEHPAAVVAHRTSPTNMGLALLANLSAYDFGYIPAGQLVDRTGKALQTMQSLERFRGHLFNWYDTVTLKPLPPRYVSSVDSGNLAGHLLTLRPGLLAVADQRILAPRIFEGLGATLGIALDASGELATPVLARLQKDLESADDSRPATIAAAMRWLEQLAASAAEVSRSFDAGPGAGSSIGADGTPWNDAKWWATALERQCRTALDELQFLAPFHAHLLTLPPAGERRRDIAGIGTLPTLRELAGLEAALPAAGAPWPGADATPAETGWLDALRPLVAEASRRARARMAEIDRLAQQTGELARMEYDFLYDRARHLLSVGYNVDERRLDASYYDLLASEARLSSFVAIAQGQLPQESWFALGRLLTSSGGEPILVSWSGSMFEYLMPSLVMPVYENTLLDQTCRAAVASQIAYANQNGVAWGISECGYNAVDASLNYQYRAFGVPGLGLKRGLAGDLVIAPYATALALTVAPEQACANLQRLALEGLEGKYGFYEAVDYTPSRLPRGKTNVVIRSFMAHHQGMSLLALVHLLLDRPMQARFEAEPLFRATTLLLQERIPEPTAFHLPAKELDNARESSDAAEMPIRILTSPDTPVPVVQLLSNGRYHVMVTNAGGGYSRWKDLAVTRWHEDSTRDNWGSFCYIRDVSSGEFWSAAHQPTLKKSASYQAIFSDARAEFRRRDQDYDTHTEIVVSPEDDIELRRLCITNRSRTRREIEVTTYAEVVLASAAADALHPAFGNLFVQTEIVRERHAILCTRRPRSVDEHSPWMFHQVDAHGGAIGGISFETDRMKFVGRGRNPAAPLAMTAVAALSDSQGSVLDPIVAIRYRITLDPQQSTTIDMVTGIGETRAVALDLIEKYQDRRLADRVFELAWTHSQVVLRQINATEADAQLYGRLASSIIYANESLRAEAGVMIKNQRGQSGLWGYAISGDLPVVLVQIGDVANIDVVRRLVQAHAYWRLKGLVVDLVIWNEDRAGYRQVLQEQIIGLIAAGFEASLIDRPGGIFLRHAEQISSEDRILFHTVARAIITDMRGTIADQIKRRKPRDAPDAPGLRLVTTRARRPETAPPAASADALAADMLRRGLKFFNGIGGFSPDGREYVIGIARGQVTPAPWVNVMANAQFGSVISENGGSYTWGENAHNLRLTPWANDPVGDASGEALYLRDEESGHFWSPAPLPCPGASAYITRHGFGYSVFEHSEDGLVSELCVYVDLAAPVKFSVLKVRNESGRPRRLSATGYVEWVLGERRPKSAMHVVTEIAMGTGALCARNSYSTEFGDRMAFFDVDDSSRNVSGDRTEFLGRNGATGNPAAMGRTRLSGRVGPGMDPCGAIQVPFELADGEECEIVFRLGIGRNADDAGHLVERFRGPAAAHAALAAVREYWERALGAVRVETPDESLNILANGWLVYQTLACRLWARSGYYQSGGAYGFRDQLQDVMALVHAEPGLVREHLLRSAAHQFLDGDVQHWWHPPSGRGVRTRCSDDYLWLPLATCRYVLASGDTGILDQPVGYLEGRSVGPDEDSYYDLPGRSETTETLYQHCARAVLHGLKLGAHGLPLMGSGDWNDGMNLVGIGGKGESVWLAFFTCEVLTRFSELARERGDTVFAERCAAEATAMRQRIELYAWDGEWYRRAYFDDGSPLGSAGNEECRIDSVPQSWSVLSGISDAKRSRSAMDAVDKHLVRRDRALVQLLDPPFDKSALNPGYIKGYVPGVRENGGQYTHAAIWSAMAFAGLGDNRRAWELFDMINPVRHGDSEAAIAVYKVEPYVIAADVYAVAPHAGRGGWTWYTGSAGWMYRLILESLLGLRLEAGRLRFAPCLPADWPGFKLHYRYRSTVYHIAVQQTHAGSNAIEVTVDGVAQADAAVTLADDLIEHAVEVRMGGTRE